MSDATVRLARASDPAPSGRPESESKVDTSCDALLNTAKSTYDPFKETFSSKGSAFHHVSSAVSALASLQGAPSQLLNTGIAQIPLFDKMPGMPAAVISAAHLGTPHAHDHPPSDGFPLPSIGATIGSGCLSVLIGGMPAARVMDMGIAPTCGGLTPYFDIQTGSSNTFIGGMRAARMGIDMTRHCNPMGHAGKSGEEAEGAAKEGEQAASEAAKVSSRARWMGRAGKAWKGGNAALGPASGAATAADDASQDEGEAAAMIAAQTAADAAMMLLGTLMGKDPGIEPSMGMLMDGNPSVLIGGFPMPDSQMMWHGVKHGIGKHVRPKRRKWAQDLRCELFGEPVSAVTGEVKNDFTDYETDEVVPFKWGRHYCSGWRERNGPLGYGFRHAWQHELQLLRTRAIYTDPRGTTYAFERDADGTYGGCCQGYEIEQFDGGRWLLRHEVEGDLEFERFPEPGRFARCVGYVSSGARSVLHWNEDGRLQSITQVDERGQTRRVIGFEYDGFGRVLEVVLTDVDGHINHIAKYRYDRNGCLVNFFNALDAVSACEYDTRHRIVRLTDANGYAFFYRYDTAGRCVESGGQDGLWHVLFQYHPGRTIVTEADGGKWTVIYNEVGTILRVVDPYGGATEYVLDPAGRIVEEIDSGGRALRWLYDVRDRNIGRLDRFGTLWPRKDDLPNLPNPLAHRVPNSMFGLMWGDVNDADLADSVLLPQQIDRWTSDAAAEGDARWRDERRQQRDAAGRVIRRTDISGRTERFEYDAEDNLLRRIDQDGAATRYTRCSWNLLASEENARGETIRYRYGLRREVASITDANGNETAYGYDLKNRMTSVTRHGRLRERYFYDGGDRLIEKRDGADNWLLKFKIGENGLPCERTLASGGKHVYEYDRLGHQTKASTDVHEITRTFDNLGRRTSDKRDGLGIEHEYDGRRLRRTSYFGRFKVVYARTANGETIQTPGGHIHCVQRGKDGRVLLQLGNGTQVCYTFDDMGRCTERVTWRTDASAAVHRVTYEYSGAGELHRVDDSVKGDTHYQYDRVHRLTGETCNGWHTRRFEYDPAGNLLSMPTCPSMQYADGNRLSTASYCQYKYNERNHVCEEIARDGLRTSYYYDSMDLLVRVEWSDGRDAWKAEYDGLCRQVIARAGGLSTAYYWDGDRLAAQIEPGGKLRVFVYVDETSLVPFMFIDYPSVDAQAASGTEYFVQCNQVGMPERIENGSGDTVWVAKAIDPYGTIEVAEGNSIEYDLRWPGHWLQREIGLHVNRFRSYSPTLGRYLQSDPLGLEGGINLYAYPPNPVAEVDVLGLHNQNEQDSHTTDEATPILSPKEQARREKQRMDWEAKASSHEAAHLKLQKEYEDLYAKRQQMLEDNGWLENNAIDQLTKRLNGVKTNLDNYPSLHSRDTEFPSTYSDETHMEMIRRYTEEGQQWVETGETSQFPNGLNPETNPAGVVAQRDQLQWQTADGKRIDYYINEKEGDGVTDRLDANGNKIPVLNSDGRPKRNMTYDHKTSVATMYTHGAAVPKPDGTVKQYPPGRNTDRTTRNAFHDDPDNLEPMSQSENSSKGSEDGFKVPTGENYLPC